MTTLTNYAALKAFSYTSGNEILYVQGCQTISDGGQGQFYWDPSDATTPDDATIIQVTTPFTTTGRWRRLYSGPVSVRWFGVNESNTDQSAAIQACLDAFSASNDVVINFDSGKYRCDQGIYVDILKTSLTGAGATLDFSAQTTGASITVKRSAAEDGYAQLKDSANYIEGLLIQGPGGSVSAVSLFNFDYTYNTLSGIEISNGGAYGYHTGIVYYTSAFNIIFRNFSFGTTSGEDNTFPTVISIPGGGTNYGERFSFENCYFGSAGCVLNCASFATVFFQNCSFDYCSNILHTIGGEIYITDCHLESSLDDNFWWILAGDNTTLYVDNCALVVSGDKNSYELGYNDSSNGGITLSNCSLIRGPYAYHKEFLITGGGRVVNNGLKFNLNEQKIPVSAYLNVFPNGGSFDTTEILTQLSLFGTPLPSIVLDPISGSANSLFISPTTGSANGFSYSSPIAPGEFAILSLWYYLPAIDTGTTFFAKIYYTDIYGNQVGIADGSLVITSANSAYANAIIAPATPCPPTASCAAMIISAFGGTPSNTQIYVNNITLIGGKRIPPALVRLKAPPASSSDSGTLGQIAADDTYFYLYVDGRWQRTAWDTTSW